MPLGYRKYQKTRDSLWGGPTLSSISSLRRHALIIDLLIEFGNKHTVQRSFKNNWSAAYAFSFHWTWHTWYVFLGFWKYYSNDVGTALLWRFQMRNSYSFNLCAIFFKLTHFVLQLIVLYGIANQRFRFLSSIQNGHGKKTTTEKLLEPKCDKIENQYVSSCWFWVADAEHGHL